MGKKMNKKMRTGWEDLAKEVITEKILDLEVRKADHNGVVLFVLTTTGLWRVEEIPGHYAGPDWTAAWVEREVLKFAM